MCVFSILELINIFESIRSSLYVQKLKSTLSAVLNTHSNGTSKNYAFNADLSYKKNIDENILEHY